MASRVETSLSTGSFEQFAQFVRQAAEDVLPQISNNGKPLALKRRRNIELAKSYYNSEALLEELGGTHGLSRSRTGQVIRGAVIFLRTHCLEETLQMYPDDHIPKRPVRQRIRETRSRAGGGASLQIADKAKEKPVAQVLQELGLPRNQWYRPRQVLRHWQPRVEVPFLQPDIIAARKLVEELEYMRTYTGEDRERKVRVLLAQVTYGIYRKHSHGDDPLFVCISSIAREGDLKLPQSSELERAYRKELDSWDIPYKKITVLSKQGPHHYTILFGLDKTRALEIFSADPKFQRSRRTYRKRRSHRVLA